MPFHQKLLNIQNFYYPLKCYLEMLTAWKLVILIKNMLKVDFEIAHTHHLNRFLRFLSYFKNKDIVIQKVGKRNNVVILNRTDIFLS